METVTIKTYTASELKEQFPEGLENALEHWREDQTEIFWTDEIVESLKGLFKKAGINLINYEIGAYSPSWVRFEMPEDGEDYLNPLEDYAGQKAYNWIKSNILDGAKFKRVTYNKKYGGKGWRYDLTKKDGKAWSCGFTGYCADDDYLDSLLDDIRGGCTLSEALHNLSDCAAHLLESEQKDQASEEYFIDHADANEFKFTEDGNRQVRL